MLLEKEVIEMARTTEVIAFLEELRNFSFTNRNGEYRCKQHPSLAVKNDGISWYWHSKGIGGHGIFDYLMKIENMSFREAVKAVADLPSSPPAEPKHRAEPPAKKLILPEKAGVPLRLYDYLCKKRGIDSGIVGALMNEGKIYEDRRGNVVFVGFDENSKPRFASLRGTVGDAKFRMDCAGSDKRYGFCMEGEQSAALYVFESPIDAMSHASLQNLYSGVRDIWRQDSRLSLAGTSDIALQRYLDTHPDVGVLYLCLDNDPAGREASAAISRKYEDKYGIFTEHPQKKDFNEDLQEAVKVLSYEKAKITAVKKSHEMGI